MTALWLPTCGGLGALGKGAPILAPCAGSLRRWFLPLAGELRFSVGRDALCISDAGPWPFIWYEVIHNAVAMSNYLLDLHATWIGQEKELWWSLAKHKPLCWPEGPIGAWLEERHSLGAHEAADWLIRQWGNGGRTALPRNKRWAVGEFKPVAEDAANPMEPMCLVSMSEAVLKWGAVLSGLPVRVGSFGAARLPLRGFGVGDVMLASPPEGRAHGHTLSKKGVRLLAMRAAALGASAVGVVGSWPSLRPAGFREVVLTRGSNTQERLTMTAYRRP